MKHGAVAPEHLLNPGRCVLALRNAALILAKCCQRNTGAYTKMPPPTDADRAAQVASLRAALELNDLVPISVFAAAINKSQRTVERAIARGELRAARIGNELHVSVSHAREGYLAIRNA